METAMTLDPTTRLHLRATNRQRGFTLIEVMVSMVVITVGLITLLGAFAAAMTVTQRAKQDMVAKQLAQEAIESIVTARETADATWDQIQNTGPGNGIFVGGFQPIKQAGIDGIVGTLDDSAAAAATIQEPGPDGIVGTSDDPALVPLTDYQRSIAIAPTASGDLRTVTITVRYNVPQGGTRSYVLSGMVSQYR